MSSLTSDDILAAIETMDEIIRKAPPAPTEVFVSHLLPPKITGYKRAPIMCHPIVRWIMRLTGGDEQWGWGPWMPIERPGDPVMIGNRLYVSPAHFHLLKQQGAA